MGPDFDIGDATIEDAKELAPRLRQEDVDEILAGSGASALDALTEGVRRSVYSRSASVDGRVIAMWGVAPTDADPKLGIAWLLGSPDLSRHRRPFLRHARHELAAMLIVRPVLINFVDGRYAAALRWVTWLGFEVGEPRPLRPNGIPFHCIHISREEVELACAT